MRTFKLIDHNLKRWQNHQDWRQQVPTTNECVPGIKVCSTQKLQNIGLVVDVEEKKPYYPGSDIKVVHHVQVRWLTGPNKGKVERKKTDQVTNFSSYKNAIASHLKEVEDFESEADMVGR